MPTTSNSATRLERAPTKNRRTHQVGPHLSSAPAAPVGKPSAESRVVFFRSLAVMFKSGLPIERSLRLLSEQAEDKNMAAVALGVADRVREGHFLSNAMARYPDAFSRIQIRLVHIGETTGALDEVLFALSGYEEKHRSMVMKVKSAISYPAFIFVVAFFMLIIIPPYMMKGVFSMIANSNVRPPALTRAVMALCEITRSGWFYFLLTVTIVAAIILVPRLLKKPRVRHAVFEAIARVPVLAHVARIIATARFSRSLAVQIEVGVSPLMAFKLAAESADNPILEERIEDAIRGMRDGLTVEDSLRSTDFFPGMFIHMVRAGEETATLADMLARVADMYEVELDNTLDVFTSLLEPFVMIVMGIVVGILVIATMLPMMQVLQHLG